MPITCRLHAHVTLIICPATCRSHVDCMHEQLLIISRPATVLSACQLRAEAMLLTTSGLVASTCKLMGIKQGPQI
jgi:hypothetical protein